MKFINQVERLQTLNRLIKNERTGTPEELASCLNLGKRTLFEYIEYLKDIGLDICYDRKRKTYFYADDSILNIVFELKILNNDCAKTINAGVSQFRRMRFLCIERRYV